MSKLESNDNQFFTPKTLYSLPSAGLGVWLTCLVVGSVFTEITPYWFRLLAFILSFAFAISHFFKNKSWNKPSNYILIIVNSALIFINASGYNAVTYTNPFEKSKKEMLQQHSTIFDFMNQKDWWPDYELINSRDSLEFATKKLQREKQGLMNQFAYLKDWINGNIRNKQSRDTLNKILKYFGNYNVDTSDIAYLNLNYKQQVNQLNKTIDSLKQVISITRSSTSTTYYTIDGLEMTAEKWFDSIYAVNIDIQNYMMFKSVRKEPITAQEIDSLRTKWFQKK